MTQTTFNNVFGRQVQFSDGQFFKQLVKDFEDPGKLNYRYIELIKAMIKSDNFQRNN